MVSRYVKMAILWYAVAKEVFKAPTDLAKAYAIYKATFYAIMKVKPFSVKNTGEKKPKSTTCAVVRDWDYVSFPNGDRIKLDIMSPIEPVLILGKKRKQKIRPSDYDRKVFQKFQSPALYFAYEEFAKKLVKNKQPWFFKSKWYKEIWVKVRDLDWAEENAKLISVNALMEVIK